MYSLLPKTNPKENKSLATQKPHSSQLTTGKSWGGETKCTQLQSFLRRLPKLQHSKHRWSTGEMHQAGSPTVWDGVLTSVFSSTASQQSVSRPISSLISQPTPQSVDPSAVSSAVCQQSLQQSHQICNHRGYHPLGCPIWQSPLFCTKPNVSSVNKNGKYQIRNPSNILPKNSSHHSIYSRQPKQIGPHYTH